MRAPSHPSSPARSASCRSAPPRRPSRPSPRRAPRVARGPAAGRSSRRRTSADLAGKPIARVTVVLEGNVWDDVSRPRGQDGQAGRHADAAASRAARWPRCSPRGASRAAGSRRRREAGGAAARAARRAAQAHHAHRSSTYTAHASTATSCSRDAELSEGGEIVGADIDATVERIERVCAAPRVPVRPRRRSRRASTDDPAHALVIVDVQPGHAAPHRRSALLRLRGGPRPRVMPIANAYAVQGGRPRRRAGPRRRRRRPRAGAPRRRAGTAPHVIARPRVGRRGRATASAWRSACASTRGPLQVPRFEGNEHYDGATLDRRARPRHGDRPLGRRTWPTSSARSTRSAASSTSRSAPRCAAARPTRVQVARLPHRRARARARRVAPLPVPQARRHPAPLQRRPALVRGDRHRDRQLPRGGAAGRRPVRRPRPAAASASAFARTTARRATGARPTPARPRPRTPPTSPTPTTAPPSTCRSSIATRASSTRRSGRCRSCARGAIRASPAGPLRPASPAAARGPSSLHVRPVGPAAAGRRRSTRRSPAAPTRRAASSARPSVQVVIPVKLGPRTQLWDVAFTGLRSGEREGGRRRRAGTRRRLREHDEARRRAAPHRRLVQGARLRVRRRQVHARAVARQHARARALRRHRGRPGHRPRHRHPRPRRARARASCDAASRSPWASRTARATSARRRSASRRSASSRASRSRWPTRTCPAPSKTVVIDVVESQTRSTSRSGPASRPARASAARSSTATATSSATRGRSSSTSRPRYLPDFLISRPAGGGQLRPAEHGRPHRDARHRHAGAGRRSASGRPSARSSTASTCATSSATSPSARAPLVGTMIWRPVREVQLSGGPDYEHNDVHLFQGELDPERT